MHTLKVLTMFVIAAVATLPAQAGDVAHPEKFRQWDHVKSMVLKPGHPLYDAVGGVHHLYANPKAVQGYRAGGRFADGSVIVFDLFEAVDQDNAVTEGKRKAVLVMSRDARRHAATDGWGYAMFAPGKQQNSLDAKGQQECHACHQSRKDSGFVFSAWRD